eukprot:CAMPEP_0202830330 /NCGR_PEP_ID=MMETSP1389-20130828/16095_1 /ASSEMBLY_ACC=CAM_ASM_000865 /TAXON_ID=302021 /ORGANISM="Rhodomonas sp., Strain CCMP768" /LENGTH=240 /DNA_ID=CAMNT_0049503963 /DNA_START=87 /DNA_END=807 /DNA_ORIENTATION=-
MTVLKLVESFCFRASSLPSRSAFTATRRSHSSPQEYPRAPIHLTACPGGPLGSGGVAGVLVPDLVDDERLSADLEEHAVDGDVGAILVRQQRIVVVQRDLVQVLRHGCLEAKHRVEEEEPAVQALPDVGLLSEPVALPRVHHQRREHALVLHRLVHVLRLVQRHHPVLLPLEEDDGAAELVHAVDGAPLLVHRLVLGVPADQRVEIPALELVCVSGERLQVPYPEQTRPCLEGVARRQTR